MFTFSVVDSLSGAFRFGLADALKFDPDPLGNFAIRAIPIASPGVDPQDVASVSFVLRNGSGDIIAEASDVTAPFDFTGEDATFLGALASGDYSLTALARDSAGDPLGAPVESDFSLGTDEGGGGFAGLRVQAEESAGAGDLGGDGNVAALGGATATVPLIRRLGDPGQSANDAIHTNAADNDAYVDFGGGAGEFLEFTVTVPEAGEYDVDFGYALGGNTATSLNRSMELKVNGAIFDRHFSFPTTNPSTTGANFATYSESSARVSLQAGVNTIRLTTNGLSGPNVDYLDVRPVDPNHVVIQAESLVAPAPATQDGAVNRPITEAYTIARNTIQPGAEVFRVGAEGDSYLDWGSTPTSADLAVTVGVAGTYAMTVTYANGGTTGNRPLSLSRVSDGEPLGTFDFAVTTIPPGRTTLTTWEGWSTSQTINVTLPAGTTTLRLTGAGGSGGPNLDKIDFVLTSPTLSTVEIDHAAVVENAEGAVVGNLSVNGGQDLAVSYSTDHPDFEVSGNQLKLKDGVSLDFEASQTETVTVTATNAGGSTASTFTIAVGNDAGDDAVVDQPVLIVLTAVAVDENAAGAVVAEIAITDPDTSYDVGDITPSGTDADLFRVIAGGSTGFQLALKPGEALDYEAATQPSVTVTVGGIESDPFTPDVQDLDDTSTPDLDADEGDDLVLSPVTAEVDGETGLGAVQFRLTGVDADITGFEVSVDAGESFQPATATADVPGDYLLTIDLSSYDGAAEGIAVVRVTDAAGNQASAEGSVAITYAEEPVFPLEIQAEAFTVIDTVGTTGTALTQARVPGNVEATLPLVRDTNGDGLWDGFTGTGYMDMGGNSGDAVQFTVDAPGAGAYTLAFRYSNGGGGANGPRPMNLTVNGVASASTPQFAGTGVNGWDNWQTESVTVTLQAGTNTIRLAIPNGNTTGPNLDKVTIFPDTTADADSNLTVSATDLADPAQAVFTVAGLDFDIATVAVQVNGGALQTVVPGAAGKFVVDLDALDAGEVTVQLVVTDTSGNTASASTTATIAPDAPFSQVIQAESFTVIDTVGTTGLDLTQARVPGNTEGVAAGRPTGLWDGHTGAGYMDMGQNVGDAISFTVDAPAPGTYTLSFRYANGGATGRPMTFTVDGGAAQTLDFVPGAAWTDWRIQTVEVTLTAGSHTFQLANATATGANIDRVIISSAATDTSADTDGNLSLAAGDLSDPAAAVFTVTGLDADIVSYAVTVNGGAPQPVSPDASGQFALDLSALAPGDATIEIVVTDGAGNTAAASATATIAPDEPEAFALTIQGESFGVTDTVGTTGAFLTQARTPANPETVTPERPTGLWAGHTGDGYMDMGQDVGDAATFSVTVPSAGVYRLSFRYANGGTTDRPMAFSVDGGPAQNLTFAPGAAWTDWRIQTVDVTLGAGTHAFQIANTIATGPNIDQVTIVSTTGDTTADADGNLALELVSMDDPAAALFHVTGVDSDVTAFAVRVNGGALQTVTPNASGEFTLDLSGLAPGYASVAIIVTDANENEATVTALVTVEPEGPAPFSVQVQAETFTIIDTTGTTSATGLTMVRDASNPEPVNPDIGPDGLWDNFTGTGYVDMGTNIGDAVAFSVDVPADGVYTLTFRYANGGAAGRPMALALDGTAVTTVPFASTTTFGNWTDVSVEVTLTAGTRSFTLTNTTATGPNLDRVTISNQAADVTADADGNLALAAVDLDDPAAAVFAVTGVDSDIVSVAARINGGVLVPVLPGAGGQFTLDLSALPTGSASVSVVVTDGFGNQATATTPISIDPDGPPAYQVEIQGESFAILDTTGTSAADGLTVVRDPSNPEPVTPERPNGLWTNFTGTGYLDMGTQTGDAASFSILAPADGVYTLTFRYANGDGTGAARPMTLALDGAAVTTIPFANTTSFGNWTEVSVDVALTAGSRTFTIANAGATGPNIDRVTITNNVEPEPEVTEPGPRDVIRINFQDGSVPKAAGYLVDNFQGYGDRGNGQTYGWVTEASAIDANGADNTPIDGASYPAIAINERTGAPFDGYDPRLTGYAHFNLGNYPAGEGSRVGWEIAVENGWYEVSAAVGDTGGPNDSINKLFIEGELSSNYTPTDQYKTELVTKLVHVTDGHLTLSSQGGTLTEIQYLEIRNLPDLTPGDAAEAPDDYAVFTDPRAVTQEGSDVILVPLNPSEGFASGVDPSADIFLGISVASGRGGVALHSLTDGSFKLVETLTGAAVAITANTTAGSDSVTISPVGQLKPFTSYTLIVDGAVDQGPVGDESAPGREFQKLTSTFLTGEVREVEAREVAFDDVLMINGEADGAYQYTSIELSPDGQHLYVATLQGEIKRWDIDPSTGGIIKSSLETFTPGGDFVVGGGRRGIVGLAFDPTDPDTLWITDNYPVPLDGRNDNVPDFSGHISKVSLGAGASLTGATVQTYITGLPRSNGDHVTNSIEFRANPDFDATTNPDVPPYLLYITQGSNSAMGAPDGAWGLRPERLLNAAVLEVDPTRTPPAGGFDVSTEPLPADGLNRRFADVDNDLKNGGIAITSGEYSGKYLHFDAQGVASVREGALASSALIKEYYDPYAPGAVVSIFAEGTRNAYDLVWHSNGHLYVPTNGSAAGGNVPDDPATAANEGLNNVALQQDYLFRVEEGGYYGHPNPLRGEFVMNGGNPTSGTDPNQATSAYPVGTQPDPNYRLDSAYGLGFNRSPDGAAEYTSNVFGSSLKNALLFTEFSGGNDIRAVLFDANGYPVSDFVLRDLAGNVINTYPDPLDLIVNPDTGQIYLLTLNRSNGQSQIIRLDPAPGGTIGDTTADAGGDLTITPFNLDDPAAAVFTISGLDADIVSLSVSFDGGVTTRTLPVANGQVTLDLSALGFGTLTATLRAQDATGNVATVARSFVIDEDGGTDLVSLVTIQAEDNTPLDGTAVSYATGGGAQIQIRTAANPETGGAAGLVNGLRPGAYGLDGNTNNLDGTPGGYADYGSTNADFLTFTFNVPAGQEGAALLRFRYAHGDAANGRPLAVEINGVPAGTAGFPPTAGATADERLANWSIQEVQVTLTAGTNTVTLRSVNNTGPNIDQLEVLAPTPLAAAYDYYEAETAQLIGGPDVVPTSEDDRNALGTGYVDFVGTATQSIAWNVTVEEAGIYEVGIRYSLAATKAARPATLTVDGVAPQVLPFAGFSSAAEDEWRYETVSVQLQAGANVLTLTAPNANGANIDQLRVASAPSAPAFDPDYAEVGGSLRIELEQTADHSTRTISAQSVEFYLKVADSGLYVLDVAANAGAPNGQGLTYFVNGVQVGQTTFPGVGDAGERSVMVELTAGVEYQVRVVSNAPGASAIDYLDVHAAPTNPNADITIQSLDPGFHSDRLHFSWMDNANAVATDGSPRDFKENASVRITNSGTEPLQLLDAKLSGPFVLANPAVFQNLVLAAGQSIDVEVLFNRSAYTSGANGVTGVYHGELRLVTNDADSPIATLDLAGFWQQRNEGGWEPNVNEVWDIFGFGTRVAGMPFVDSQANSPLNNHDIYEAVNELEVLSPYWRLADGVTQAKVTQLAAFHSTGGATFGLHGPGATTPQVQLTSHDLDENSTLLPIEADGTFATATFTNTTIPNTWIGDDVFGIRVAGYSTDPTLNTPPDDGFVLPAGMQRGHFTRMFVALDAEGNVIPNTYLVIQDFSGINYDYNDDMFVVSGITPVGTGKALTITGLDDSAADDRLVFTNIDRPATNAASNAIGGQVFRNETVITLTNPGFANVAISGMTLGGADASAFQIVNAPTTIPAGGSVQVTVRFIGHDTVDDNAAVLFKGTLNVQTDAFQGNKLIQLAGLAQYQSEGGEEPTVAQIVEAFGYTTSTGPAGALNNDALVETLGDEVLMPYLERLDGSKPIEVIQIAAFLNQAKIERLSLYDVGNGTTKTQLLAQDDQQGQTVLPDGLKVGPGDTGSVARATIDRDAPFGLFVSVDGQPTFISWSDPKANDLDANIGNMFTEGQGHLIRYFQAKDAAGNVIPGTYIGIQDYPGVGSYDYNDLMFVIRNVKAHDLTAAEDANGNDVNDALEQDSDGDGILNFFDPSNVPPSAQTPYGGTAPSFTGNTLTLLANTFDEGGQGVAYNDNAGLDGGGTTFRPGRAVELVGAANDIGYVKPGEWVEYTINAPKAGTYDLSVLAKTPLGGVTVTASLAGGATLGTITLVDGHAGGSSFDQAAFATSPHVPITLAAGVQTIRLTFSGTPASANGYLLDLRLLTLVAPDDPVPTTQTPFGGTALVVGDDPVTLLARNYDDGGQGVAYNDQAGLQGGSNGGRAGSAVEVTAGGAVGWVQNGEWLEYTVNVEQAGVHTLSFLTATNAAGRGMTIGVEKNGVFYATASTTVANTGSYTNFQPGTSVQMTLEAGVQTIRVTLTGGSLDFQSFTITGPSTPEPTVQTPYGGIAPSFTGSNLTILANSFDEGGQGLAYNDNPGLDGGNTAFRPGRAVEFVGTGNDIGYVKPGEWVEYTINTPKAGIFDLSVLAKTPLSGVTVTISLGSGPALGTITLADGHPGGSNFGQAAFANSAAAQVALGAGVQTIRLTFNGTPAASGNLLDLRSLTLVAPEAPVPDTQTPFGGTAPVVGDDLVTLLARNYDDGGQGVAYNDQAGLQGGSNGGRAGSAVEVTTGGAVGWVQNGEWLEYTVNVEQAGVHTLSFNTAFGGTGARSITASFAVGGSVYETATATTPATGSWTGFQNGPGLLVDLQAGVQVVRLTFNGGAQDIQSFTLAADAPDVDPPDGGVIGHSGSVTVAQAHKGKWYHVTFDEAIEDAVVVMGPATSNNKQAATFQIRNVTSTGFDYQLDEWDYLDGVHSSETFGWMAIKAGVHTLANGQVVAAGLGTAGAGVSTISYGETFAAAPVVLAQVNGESASGAVTDRIGNVGTTGFSLQLQEEEAADGAMPARSVGWIAMSKGGSVADGVVVGATGASATNAAKAIGFGGSFDAPLDFIADLQTRNDLDPAVVRLNSLTASGANVYAEEEKSADAELVHGAEDVGFVAHERGLIFGFDHSLV